MQDANPRRLMVDVPVGLFCGWALMVGWWMRHVTLVPALAATTTPAPPWVHHAVVRSGLWWPVLPLALVVAVAVASRRWWPYPASATVAAAAACYPLLGGSIGPSLASIAVCLFTLASHAPVRRWLPWSALLVAPALTADWDRPYLGLLDASWYGELVLLVAVAAASGLLGTVLRGRQQERRRLRADELRQAAAEERLRVAREVHDVVGHSLSVISVQAAVALHVLDRHPDQVRTALQAIRSSSGDALTELRQTLGLFRGSEETTLAPAPGLDRIDDLAAALRAAGRRIDVRTDLAGHDGEIPRGVQQTAFRIVQEGLTNVIRHTPESAGAQVSTQAGADTLVVRVVDDGPHHGPLVEGNGLRGMRERVAALGGTLTVTNRPAGGVALSATLPLPRRPVIDDRTRVQPAVRPGEAPS